VFHNKCGKAGMTWFGKHCFIFFWSTGVITFQEYITVTSTIELLVKYSYLYNTLTSTIQLLVQYSYLYSRVTSTIQLLVQILNIFQSNVWCFPSYFDKYCDSENSQSFLTRWSVPSRIKLLLKIPLYLQKVYQMMVAQFGNNFVFTLNEVAWI
jgi:hypothetical protein